MVIIKENYNHCLDPLEDSEQHRVYVVGVTEAQEEQANVDTKQDKMKWKVAKKNFSAHLSRETQMQ